MKRISLLIGVLALTLFTACGGNSNTDTAGSTETSIIADATSADSTETTLTEITSTETGSSVETETSEETTEEVPEPEEVILKDLCADYFTLGVGINGSTLENQTLNIPEYMALAKKHFNSCTMTNLMKSGYILDQSGSKANLAKGDENPALSFETIDPTLEWCAENGMKMRGHTLVWHTQAPEWFFREGYDEKGDYVDRDTMLFRMESYIKQLLTHVQTEYPGVIYCWDVVNEAVDPDSADPDSFFMCRTKINNEPNPWYATIGQDYVEMAFTYARQYAAPEVKLFYNDYNTFQVPKLNGIYSLCEYLSEKGLIDGIGMQGYYSLTYPTDSSIEYAIKKYAELGLELQLTELSISVDEETEEQFEKQAKRYGSLFYLLHNLDTAGGGPANITNVTVFGLVDHYREGDTTNTRLFDKDYNPKPAFDKIVKVMQFNY